MVVSTESALLLLFPTNATRPRKWWGWERATGQERTKRLVRRRDRFSTRMIVVAPTVLAERGWIMVASSWGWVPLPHPQVGVKYLNRWACLLFESFYTNLQRADLRISAICTTNSSLLQNDSTLLQWNSCIPKVTVVSYEEQSFSTDWLVAGSLCCDRHLIVNRTWVIVIIVCNKHTNIMRLSTPSSTAML